MAGYQVACRGQNVARVMNVDYACLALAQSVFCQLAVFALYATVKLPSVGCILFH